MDPFLGEIRAFAFGIVPRGWHLCDGTILSVNQNSALYALLGNRYGGSAPQTFALPDLRGRVPISFGVGAAGSTYVVGNQGGAEGVALTANQMPVHGHTMTCSSQPASTNQPEGKRIAVAPSGKFAYADAPSTGQMAPGALAISGGSSPHNNLQPSLVLNFCIATMGLFPSRS